MTKKTPASRFEAACRKWQVTLGLTDWSLCFTTARMDEAQAQVAYDVETRQATITCSGKDLEHSPERVALHEMLHVLLADVLSMAAKRSSDLHPDVYREEHRVIERLLNAVEGRP